MCVLIILFCGFGNSFKLGFVADGFDLFIVVLWSLVLGLHGVVVVGFSGFWGC